MKTGDESHYSTRKHRIEEAEQTINTEVKKRWKLINKIRRIQGVQQFKKQIKLN